jgi:hypothetical protein
MQRDYEREQWRRGYDEGREGPSRGYDEDRDRWGRGYGPTRGRYEDEPRSGMSREEWGTGQWDRGRRDYGRENYGRQGMGRSDYEQEYGRGGWERSGYDRQDFGRSRGEREGYPPMSWSYTEIWMIPGPYSGRGPRGYQRSDERIREEICDRLTQHGQLDASDVQVQVNHGEVTLQGTVDHREAKRSAEDTAESVAGVRDVHNQLRVQQGAGQGQAGRFGTYGRSPVQRAQLHQGMDIVGSDANRIGQVKEVRDQDFLVDRAGQRDLYVPFDAVRDVMGNQIILTVPASQVDNQGWASPTLTPAGMGQTDQQSAATGRRR